MWAVFSWKLFYAVSVINASYQTETETAEKRWILVC